MDHRPGLDAVESRKYLTCVESRTGLLDWLIRTSVAVAPPLPVRQESIQHDVALVVRLSPTMHYIQIRN